MEKEIADILLRGELPILPPESFVTNQQSDTKVEKEPGDALEKDKIKKLKRKQYFRRQNLKRQKEKSKLVAATPSFDFNAYTSSSFSRKDHDLHIQSMKNQDEEECIVEERNSQELLQLIDEQQKQIEMLEKENDKLQLAIYRIKKHLNIVSSM